MLSTCRTESHSYYNTPSLALHRPVYFCLSLNTLGYNHYTARFGLHTLSFTYYAVAFSLA